MREEKLCEEFYHFLFVNAGVHLPSAIAYICFPSYCGRITCSVQRNHSICKWYRISVTKNAVAFERVEFGAKCTGSQNFGIDAEFKKMFLTFWIVLDLAILG